MESTDIPGAQVPEVKVDIPQPMERQGHARLAAFMGAFPEAAVFHRFASLNAQNILYLQAELLWLEEALKQLAAEDVNSSSERQREYSRNWFLLSHSGQHPGCDTRQWDLFMKIREVLNQYNNAILQQKEISKMEPPGRLALSVLRKWMRSSKSGNISLSGSDHDLWTTTDPPDLVALIRDESDDLLSEMISLANRKWIQPVINKISKNGWPMKRADGPFLEPSILVWVPVSKITSLVTVALSSILPLSSIFILHLVKTVQVRLGIIAGSTVVFSVCVAVVTKARRVEIFAAAAAYVAIQVVFIAGDGSPNISEK